MQHGNKKGSATETGHIGWSQIRAFEIEAEAPAVLKIGVKEGRILGNTQFKELRIKKLNDSYPAMSMLKNRSEESDLIIENDIKTIKLTFKNAWLVNCKIVCEGLNIYEYLTFSYTNYEQSMTTVDKNNKRGPAFITSYDLVHNQWD